MKSRITKKQRVPVGGKAKAKSPPTKTRRVRSSPTTDCSICHEPMLTKKDTATTSCAHTFHKACLSQWCSQCKAAEQEPTCPMCRADITADCRRLLGKGKPIPSLYLKQIIDADVAMQRTMGVEDAAVTEKKRAFLKKLRFPPETTEDDWKRIRGFASACQRALNYEEVRDELG